MKMKYIVLSALIRFFRCDPCPIALPLNLVIVHEHPDVAGPDKD